MFVTFRDNIGIVCVETQDGSVGFCDGKAYFTGCDKMFTDYEIDIQNILEISENLDFDI